jgi:hypothetical protein
MVVEIDGLRRRQDGIGRQKPLSVRS